MITSTASRNMHCKHTKQQLNSMRATERAPMLLVLQPMYGNLCVQRVVACIQANLKIGQPGNVYEQEADRVANAVMKMPEPEIQREVDEEEEEMLQTKSRRDATEVTNDLESKINAIRGGGWPLVESEHAYFEPRFGVDFSQVRLHSDTQAAESTQALNAKAYTLGQDLVFGTEQYTPGTSEGRRLMAHELTHVIQQSGKK